MMQRHAFELEATPEAAVMARRTLLARDGTWPSTVRDDVLLLLTELVTNAVRHADDGPGRTVGVEVRRGPGAVKVSVSDAGPGFVAEATASGPDGTGGWGLVLVDRIADRWAVTPIATGTRVWFEIRYEE
jgi:anti-sigma regulatory factor (Ser/Thr protein kinase)